MVTTESTHWRHFYWHSLLLSSLAFSHPIFATLQQQPEYLLAHDLQGLNLLIWILTVALAAGLLFNALVYVLAKLVPAFKSWINSASGACSVASASEIYESTYCPSAQV